ncbi:MAG: response regulator [Candidatus Aminicenantes bacterium]|jgi:putative nucleotidyltransferase with HDIG domain
MVDGIAKILVVEDERIVSEDIKVRLQKLGYSVPTTVRSGEEAIEKVKILRPDLVLMDIVLEGEMDGIEAASTIRSLYNIPVVFLTAYADPKTLERAKITEPYGYVLKPFDDRDLNISIDIGLHKHRMDKKLRETEERLQKTLEDTIKALSSAVELRDPYTAGHQRRVSDLSCAIASELGLPSEQIDGLRLAGLIHDVGKIRIPAEILSWPNKLTELDFSLIKAHPQAGYEIIKTISFPYPVARIVLQHHERIDGSGYPAGLSQDEILLETKILSVADVVEAIASHRPYRAALGITYALNEISKNSGFLFDPDAVEACLTLFKDKGFQFNSQ